MFRLITLLLLSSIGPLRAQAPATPPATLAKLDFLLGTWSAKAEGAGAADGTYTFKPDLSGHVLQRTSSSDSCKGPQSFDCQHHDQLTIFSDPNSPHGTGLYALYLDNEGHVIYYSVSTPDDHTALFLSQGPASAPRFRLVYHLEGSGKQAVMSGKIQFAAPNAETFRSYLEWTGSRQ
jgi:hypothetical protein